MVVKKDRNCEAREREVHDVASVMLPRVAEPPYTPFADFEIPLTNLFVCLPIEATCTVGVWEAIRSQNEGVGEFLFNRTSGSHFGSSRTAPPNRSSWPSPFWGECSATLGVDWCGLVVGNWYSSKLNLEEVCVRVVARCGCIGKEQVANENR